MTPSGVLHGGILPGVPPAMGMNPFGGMTGGSLGITPPPFSDPQRGLKNPNDQGNFYLNC
jgi:hypothetical protein